MKVDGTVRSLVKFKIVEVQLSVWVRIEFYSVWSPFSLVVNIYSYEAKLYYEFFNNLKENHLFTNKNDF